MTFGTGPDDTDSLYVSSTAISFVDGQPIGSGEVTKIADASSTSPVQSVFVQPGEGGINTSSGLEWGPDGNLYVVDLAATAPDGQGNILEFNADGSFIGIFTQPQGETNGSLQYEYPSDMVFDNESHVLTANLGYAYPPGQAGSINEYNAVDGSFNQTLVNSVSFPTNPNSGFSGISPSQLALYPTSSTITVAGVLTPGNGTEPGVLTAGSVTFLDGGTFSVDLEGTAPGSTYGQLVSMGTVDLNGATLQLSLGYTPSPGDSYTLISTPGPYPVEGTFAGLPEGSLITIDSLPFTISYVGGNGHDVTLTQAYGTLTTLTSSVNPIVAGEAVTFTARVSSNEGGSPSGSVAFMDGSTLLATVLVTNGTATYSIVSLASGSHNVTAVFTPEAADVLSSSSWR